MPTTAQEDQLPMAATTSARVVALRREDWPYRFEVVPLAKLGIDARYQRPLTTFWRKIVRVFNPALVGCLIVSERADGTMVLMDGQTRHKAMSEIRTQSRPTGAPCLIYEGLSVEQEAALFADLQTQRRGMTTYDRFRAQLMAKDERAVGISRVVRAEGFQLSGKPEPHTLHAIGALERMWNVDGEGDHLADILQIVKSVWGTEDRKAVSAQILTGLSTFVRNQERLDRNRLIARLSDVTPQLVMNKAAQIREGSGYGTGAAKSTSDAILQEYMRKR